MGSANAAFEDDSDDGGLWAAVVDVACAYPDYAEPDPLMDEPEDDDVDEWEAFRAKACGAEDEEDCDRAGSGTQPVKEGEETDVEEEVGAATLLEEDSAPRSESQPAPHNALHMLTIGNDLVPRRALDEEGYTPQIGDGRPPRTTSLCGGQVADTMSHAHRLHDVVRSPEFAHLDDPEPAIRAREGQSPGFGADAQAHQAPWPEPGTVIEEPDVHPASAAQLEGEKLRVPAMCSEQTAAPDTPSSFNSPQVARHASIEECHIRRP